MKFASLICFLCLSCLALANEQNSPQQSINIVMPKPDDNKSSGNSYRVQLLKEALATQNVVALIRFSAEPMNEKRAIYSLQNGKTINLYWFSNNKQVDLALRAIPIPLYKGLHGQRVLLIHQDLADKFAEVEKIDQLREFVGLQKQSWSDYDILVANGLNIDGSHSYFGMQKALKNRLADYFPRSALTVNSEYKSNKTDNIIIEGKLLLQYANDYYFFTNNENKVLASKLEEGLKTLIQTGRFDEIFDKYYVARLKGLNLSQRTVISLQQ